MIKNRLLGRVAGLLVLSLIAITAHADVKLVQHIKAANLPGAATGGGAGTSSTVTRTLTTYYKGDRQRTEVGPDVTIYDCAGDKVYHLNTATETYTVSTMANSMGNSMAALEAMGMKVKFKSNFTLTPGGKQRVIAGKRATNYIVQGTMKAQLTGANVTPEMSAMIPTTSMRVENWATEEVTIPATCAKMIRATMSNQLPGVGGGGLQPLIEKMSRIKGAIVESTTTVTLKSSSPAMSGMIPTRPIVTTISLVSVSTDPLSDALFQVPANYRKVEAPKPQAPGMAAPL